MSSAQGSNAGVPTLVTIATPAESATVVSTVADLLHETVAAATMSAAIRLFRAISMGEVYGVRRRTSTKELVARGIPSYRPLAPRPALRGQLRESAAGLA